jgi:hypothetical protein
MDVRVYVPHTTRPLMLHGAAGIALSQWVALRLGNSSGKEWLTFLSSILRQLWNACTIDVALISIGRSLRDYYRAIRILVYFARWTIKPSQTCCCTVYAVLNLSIGLNSLTVSLRLIDTYTRTKVHAAPPRNPKPSHVITALKPVPTLVRYI